MASMKSAILLIQTLLFLSLAFAARDTDQVKSLPDCGKLPSKWYSGYLNVTSTKALHYVYIQSLD